MRAYESVEITLQAVWSEIESFDPEYVTLRRGEPVNWETIRVLLQPLMFEE